MATKPSLKKKQKAYSKASKARKLRSTAEAAERNNYSGKISEKKATRMKKKATKLYAASKKAHNTSGMASAKDVANRAKYDAYKKKKKAAENKEPLNYGTPMNYSMKPGFDMVPGKNGHKNTPGTFRDTPINNYMGSPVNYGTESPMNDGHDKKKAALEKARKAREEFQRKNPGAKLNVKTKQPVKPKAELKTTVKGDLPSGGYSEAQKKKAIAQMKADAAKKKKGIK